MLRAMICVLAVVFLISCDDSKSDEKTYPPLSDQEALSIVKSVIYVRKQADEDSRFSGNNSVWNYVYGPSSFTKNYISEYEHNYSFTNYYKYYDGKLILFQGGTCTYKWDQKLDYVNKEVFKYDLILLMDEKTYSFSWKDTVAKNKKSLKIDGKKYSFSLDESSLEL